jgi:disulfide bond formation protein DsbB
MIQTRMQRRLLNAAGVVAVVGLMAYALYTQYALGLEACPLCIFQRMALIALGCVMLAAALHAPTGVGVRAYALLGVLAALVGAGISARHVWIQNSPPGDGPGCGPGLSYMLEAFPIFDTVKMVFTGSGECATVNWTLLGLSMPAWVLICFAILGTVVVVANWRRVFR